ncbi:MAG: shikimate dehydrogenase [Clostridiales bacterium]|nr:shikimate dehydrogenase [Clostridiales bacterium]
MATRHFDALSASVAAAGGITARTEIYGVIGHPIGHSLSPQIHNTLARELGVDMAYLAFSPNPNDIRISLEGLFAAGVRGLNVTMPFKGDAYKFAGARHPETDCFMAANTLVAERGGGAVHAYNTDFRGFVNAFEMQAGRTFGGLKVLLLGAGASCRTLSFAIAGQNAKSVSIASRARGRARSVAELCGKHFKNCKFENICYSDSEMYDIIAQSDVIVNTTPVGMSSGASSAGSADCAGSAGVAGSDSGADSAVSALEDVCPGGIDYAFSPSQCVADLIYSPRETCFLRKARLSGALAMNGLGMLLCQAALAFELFTGISVPEPLLERMMPMIQKCAGAGG